ncbi:protein-tyrosine phosphatase 2 [Cordyceps fumosorosea ARSEF 2679]|uniref:Protein-tyrosine phosphatase 2 n=1 Tax=Cordyceps fumosorosea (strain ARSEF 2679) TaxID=1081104 RepID=A0A167VS24_CORFA|nr:protein-tyrosine phosphatase 2 [Cordyceps fumosorosea ARSEF 2679]OAA62923.1 protein-tyrosine phosphatase 2 [Cordyceps fumosorosea ARSEF 2679]
MRLAGTNPRIAKRLLQGAPSTQIRARHSIVPQSMDKISIHKLRRKPKPPAIETSIDSDTKGNTVHLTIDNAAVPKPSKSPSLPSRMSPFRRLRSGKRARSCSPAASQLGEPVAATVSTCAKPADDEQGEEPGPRIPAFLTQSDSELQERFQDLQKREGARAYPSTNPNEETMQWIVYQNENEQGRNVMDRYYNIRPWNHNRVKLNVPDGALDYVNASPVTVAATDEAAPTYKYIAMQGPTVPSIDSVWRMVAENTTSTAVIVQLTPMNEGPQVKCSQYFPFLDDDPTWALNAGDGWGDGWAATLTHASTEALCDGAVVRRELRLHVAGEEAPRTVWHLLYLRWPDFGTPALTDVPSFFALMGMSRALATGAEEPRFVHCSAGVGRTGTFIGLEHLIRELDAGALDGLDEEDDDAADPIFEVVDALRRQRRFMVQSVQQYAFLYQVMRQLWAERHGGMPDNDGAGEGTRPPPKRLEVATDQRPDDSASVRSLVSEGGVSLGSPQD